MISAAAVAHAAFTTALDGDVRSDATARAAVAVSLGVTAEWAVARQVHGGAVRTVEAPGSAGDADALVTSVPGLPLAVFTADCVGVVLDGVGRVGVAHAGWRGVAAGVVRSTADAVGSVATATIGPHIRSCCFEVGSDVADQFPGHTGETRWGTTSVDLSSAIRAQLPGVAVVDFGACTMCGAGWFSHRRDADVRRMATLAWIGPAR